MTPKQINQDKLAALRQQAEAALEKETDEFTEASPEQLKQLHELRVHQIELKLQNQELIEAEFERELARKRYANLYNSAPVGYLTLDDNNVILEANQTGIQMLHQTQDQLLGRRFTTFIASQDQDSYHFFFQKLGAGEGVFHVRVRLNIPLNGYIYTLLEGRQASNHAGPDRHDKALQYHLTFSNITELTETEQAYQTLVEHSLQGVLVLENDMIVFANTAVTRITGYKPEELTDLSIEQMLAIIHPDHRQEIDRRRRVRQAGETSDGYVEIRFFTKDGRERWLETYTTPIEYRGKPAIHVVILDITKRKKSEVERNQLLTEVITQREHLKKQTVRLAEIQEAEQKALARELHDQIGQQLTSLNLNLNTIRVRCLAQTPPIPPPVIELVDYSLTLIEETTERIQNVTNELRPPVLDDYGLFAALKRYVTELMPRVEFAIQLEGRALETRLRPAVEMAIFRVIQEALTNVIKHSRASHVTICLKPLEDVVSLTITDNGIGFESARQSTPAKRTGWGMFTMIERMVAVGGRCLILSEPGQGTQVVVEVPR